MKQRSEHVKTDGVGSEHNTPKSNECFVVSWVDGLRETGLGMRGFTKRNGRFTELTHAPNTLVSDPPEWHRFDREDFSAYFGSTS